VDALSVFPFRNTTTLTLETYHESFPQLFRRAVLAVAGAAVFSAALPALAQDIKPRLIRFGYGLNEQSNQAARPRCLPRLWRKRPAAK